MSGALGFMMGSVASNPVVQVGVSSVESSQHDGTITIHSSNSTRAGDLMVALLARDNSGSWTLPSGWTGAVNSELCVAWRISTSLSGADFIFSVPDPVGVPAIRGAIVSYRHCVFDAIGTIGAAGSGATCDAPSVTVSDLGLLLAFFANERDLRTFTTPDGMLPVVASFDPDAPSIAAFSQLLSAGATGTRTSTPSGGGDSSGVLIALKGVF